jgi:hypothetical protein
LAANSSSFALALLLNESIPPCTVDLTRLIIGFNKSLFDIICFLANAFAFEAISPKKPSPCFSACSG